MNMDLAVLGAGGHAKVVIATAQAAGYRVIAAYDDNPLLEGTNILEVPILLTTDDISTPVVIGIGDNRTRARIAQRHYQWATIVHPRAVVHTSVLLGEGSVVFANCVVQPGTVVGRHSIINTASSVDHDCRLGAFVHIGPGAHLCGGVTVGEGSLFGVGASTIPGVQVGSWSTVGGGGCVTRDIADGLTVVGVPAVPPR